MLPQTPHGFRDILPDEASWRASINDEVQQLLASWGYKPIETPALEVQQTIEAGSGVDLRPISLFDSDGRVLVLRPDVTPSIARMVATRLADQPGPFRFRYKEQVFREEEFLRAQAREVTQIGVEAIGTTGPVADAEVVAAFVESLAATGLSDFTVSICSVGVLRALIARAGRDGRWASDVLDAYHASNFVALEELATAEGVPDDLSEALCLLPHLRGGREAIERCRASVDAFGCADVLDSLEQTWDLLDDVGLSGHVDVDFSIMTSFNYYTGLVIEAYAPGIGLPLGAGGRYDSMLAAFGRDLPAAGFAFSLERVMSALVQQGAHARGTTPDVLVGGADLACAFRHAVSLRSQGLSVCLTDAPDVAEQARRRGIGRWSVADASGAITEGEA